MIIDAISDLHGHFPKLDGGDLLIIAGDITARDTVSEWAFFFSWLKRQPYSKKIIVGGNHDNFLLNCLPTNEKEAKDLQEVQSFLTEEESEGVEDFDYLCDSGTEFEGLKIWGSPWTAAFEGMNPHCKAFTAKTDEQLADKWSLIPHDIDILITHSPLIGFGDQVKRYDTGKIENVGSYSLKMRIWQMENPPRLIVTGHIHEGYGVYKEKWNECCDDEFEQIIVKASHVNERYQPVNPPIRIIL